MIVYSFYSLFAALTAVYALFLFRIRSGLRALSSEHAHPSGSDAVSASMATVPGVPAAQSGRDLSATESIVVSDEALPTVTVLVPMRNEEDTIPDCIHSLLLQDYAAGKMAVILIDDHSEDGTREAAHGAVGGDPRFRVLAPADGVEGKKEALTAGVAHADTEIIVTTDADCRHDALWLRHLVRPFTDGADVCAGPVVFDRRRTLFSRLQALEFLGLVGVGAGFFGIGYPRLCNGANFAYRRELFSTVGGYEGNEGIHSGDDEFLLHKIVYRHGGHAAFVTHPAAMVRTRGPESMRDFLRQRIRWASKTRRYEDGRFVSFLVLLFVYFLFAAVNPLVSVTSTAALAAGMLFFFLKLLVDTAVLFAAAALFHQPLRPLDVFVAEVLHPYYIVIVSLLGFVGMFSWKNRRLQNR
ncbi:MAG: glycosyltransferase [Bacteroidetes bacterium]|nr:glycosyltransferase [Bacteroidota bacterium]